MRDRPLRVLHVVRTPDPAAGGFLTYWDSVRRGLAGRPVDLRLDSVFPRNSKWRVLAARRPLQFLGRVRRALRHSDMVHVHGLFGWHVVMAVGAAWGSGKPYVITTHGNLYRAALCDRRIGKRLYLIALGRRMLQRASAVLVTTPAERDVVRRHATHVRIEQVMPGLDVPETPARLERRSPVSRSRLSVLYLGRLHPHKGLHWVIRSLARARGDGLEVCLAVAGTGQPRYLRHVQRMVVDLGLRTHVDFLGHVHDEAKARAFRDADVLVLVSRSENFGFGVAEAMAAGVPVIISENVGLASLVARERCGRVIPVGDVEALRQALLAYADPALRREHGRRAHAAARAAFSLPCMGAALEAIYRDVAGPGAPRGSFTPPAPRAAGS